MDTKPADHGYNWNWNDKKPRSSDDHTSKNWYKIPTELMNEGAIDLRQLGINGKLHTADATECSCCCGKAPEKVSKSEFIEVIMQAQAVMSTNMFIDISDAYVLSVGP